MSCRVKRTWIYNLLKSDEDMDLTFDVSFAGPAREWRGVMGKAVPADLSAGHPVLDGNKIVILIITDFISVLVLIIS